jgi:drug/metabolite transporter (DMT)-like permease
MLVAVLLLGELFTWLTGIGAVLVVLGVYLIAAAGKGPKAPSTAKGVGWKGVILALTAAVVWTIGAAALRIGVTDMDPFVAAAIRIPVATIVLTFFVLGRKKGGILQFSKYGFRNMALAAGAGVLTYGVAAVGYVTAMQLIGVGKTVLLTAIGPLFILPFSIFILKEKPTRYSIVGIFICVAGVFLVSI